jgi:cytochrome c biogenesis protein CcmG, thiol:disulfide interchange protein DsbE
MTKYLWIGLFIVVVVAGYLLLGGKPPAAVIGPQPALPPAGQTSNAPDFTLTDTNGKQVSLSDFRGKVVVLDFWATWCPPCKMEIPGFIELQKTYGAKGVEIVGVALDEPARVAEFAAKNGMNYTVVLGTDEIALKYGGIDGIPTTVLIDRNGKIVNRFEGYHSKDSFESEIKKLL